MRNIPDKSKESQDLGTMEIGGDDVVEMLKSEAQVHFVSVPVSAREQIGSLARISRS
jgi:hypothetical protein